MTAKEFDKKFDDGEDVLEYFDLSKARRSNLKSKKINIDFPTWMINLLDKEAEHIGVSRESIIKVWLAERLENSYMIKSSGNLQENKISVREF